MFTRRLMIGIAVLALGAVPASAQKRFQVHGFGGWAYGTSDDLRFSLARPDGNADTAELGINVTAQVLPKLRVIGQGTRRPAYEGGRTVLDYAFAEWAVADALKVRAGRVKHPFGVYGEIYHIGALRPLYTLPQSIYGGNGFTAQSYDGGGVTGAWHRSEWTLQYDVYAGKMSGDFRGPGMLVSPNNDATKPILDQSFNENDVVGGRILVQPPLQGLTISGSAYRGKILLEGTTSTVRHDANATLLSAEFLNERWIARAEYGTQETKAQFEQTGKYVELAFKITSKWQVASRWDQWHADVPSLQVPDPRRPPFVDQLVEHEDIAFGVNYWVRPNIVVRANYHVVEGNRYAYPDREEDVIAAMVSRTLRDDASAFIVGAQFHF